MKRILISASSTQPPSPGESRWSEEAFRQIEQAHPEGLTTQQVLESFITHGDRLTEAAFRKYVQLGLLPRSVRIGRKGKHRGSQGLYPATVVRQIERIRRLMAQGLTIEEIQREFPFFGGDIDELSRQLRRLYSGIEQAAAGELQADATDQVLQRAIGEARAAGEELIRKLRAIEERLLLRARMARAAV